MKTTIPNLRSAVEKAGGKLEEDFGGLDSRTLQMVAPDGKRWAGRGAQCCVVLWAKRPALESAKRFNEDALKDALDTLSYGLEDIPDNELDFYADD